MQPPEGALGIGDPVTVGITVQKSNTNLGVASPKAHALKTIQPTSDLALRVPREDGALPRPFGPETESDQPTQAIALTNASLRQRISDQQFQPEPGQEHDNSYN